MHSGSFDTKLPADDDPVELRDRMTRVEARAGWSNVEGGLELIQTAGN